MATETKVEQKGKLAAYINGVKVESKKVVWPSLKTVMNYTAVVIAVSLSV